MAGGTGAGEGHTAAMAGPTGAGAGHTAAMAGGTGVGEGHTAAMGGPREPRRRLEAVLGALYDLGEEPGGARRAAEQSAGSAAGGDEEHEEEDEEESRGPQPAAGGRRGARDFFGELRAELSAATATAPSAPPSLPPAVEVVVFRARSSKQRHGPAAAPPGTAQVQVVNEEKNVNGQEFNFEKARLEVHKFGITGYKKHEQRIWEQERAVMLGAKPPKKEHVNYRTYQEKMKEKKAEKDADKEKTHKGDSLKKKKKEQKERKAKRKKSVPNIWPAGQVGKFRDGTLILQSRDIKKIKSSKVRK